MMHVQQWNLRGPVNSCRIERRWYSRRSGDDSCAMEEHRDAENLDFRPDGRLILHQRTATGGSRSTQTLEYDSAGRLTVSRFEDPAGQVISLLREYDTDGRLVRVRSRDHQGRERVAETYAYDSLGRKTKIVQMVIDTAPAGGDVGWCIEGSDLSCSVRGAKEAVTQYDEFDRPVRTLFRDTAGEVVNSAVLLYDAAGHLIEEVVGSQPPAFVDTLPPEALAEMNATQQEALKRLMSSEEGTRRTHRYDDRGRRVESRLSLFGMAGQRRLISYNEHDDPIEEITEHESQDFGIGEDGTLEPAAGGPRRMRSVARMLYEYDAHGNWTRKTLEGRADPATDFTVYTIEERSITYFP